ncbi:hypothetical protein ACFWY6_20285, partial [Streptomyces sp. NPDC059037]
MSADMSDVTRTKHGRPVHHWRRDLVELAALFTAVGGADAGGARYGRRPHRPARPPPTARGV